MTETTDLLALTGRDLDGRTTTWELKRDGAVNLPGSALFTQRVLDTDGTGLLLRRPRRGGDAAAHRGLDNEIRALARLSRAYPGGRRPFPRLVGYDMDGAAPWALLEEPRGKPGRSATNGLFPSAHVDFAVSVLDAVAHAALVEVSINGLALDTLYVEGKSVQVVSFEHALLFGEPRPHQPDQTAPGPASDQHDLLAAGKVLYEVFAGVPAQSDRPDLSELAMLASRLPDLFAPDGSRPSAVALLVQLGRVEVPAPVRGDHLDAGRAAFQAARGRKLPPTPAPPRRAGQPVPPARGPRPARLIAVGLLCAVVLAAVLVLALGGR
ncbi:hypothetical protein [Actinokineospora sp. NBRC 105648]|uniref:hypothetical protein n=1 Tax=Actinokineospora sp. NBRC 105648 TaxID=3032206 RepID=UPI0024A16987|nr:hypothetical protein [Actinokineospora sp. NBRC 105648]GLZ39072.1 hypothetical protein Acsp05_26960 [Actinokineospora sp. NBRC 105648]